MVLLRLIDFRSERRWVTTCLLDLHGSLTGGTEIAPVQVLSRNIRQVCNRGIRNRQRRFSVTLEFLRFLLARATQFYDLANRLQKRGYTTGRIEKILGRNFVRYAQDVWGA